MSDTMINKRAGGGGTLKRYFADMCRGDEWNEPHVWRFEESANMLLAHAALNSPDCRHDILEVGGASPFTRFLTGFASVGSSVCSTNEAHDLRDECAWPMNHAGTFDLVVCMEVLEHIKDMDPPFGSAPRHCFDGSGAVYVLNQCRAMLKRGGLLFLTTPNACGWKVMSRMFKAASPRVYDPHVREYSPHELSAMITAAGLDVELFETRDVWGDHMMPANRNWMLNVIERPALHGDDIFVLARRTN